MMPFSTGTGLERMRVVGLDQDRWWVELEDAGSPRYSRMAAMLICGLRLKHLSAKTRKKGGRRGLGPWPLRCLSQILSERKERMLRLLSIGVQLLRTFYCWGGHVFIMYIVPNLRVTRILSYWMIFLAFIE